MRDSAALRGAGFRLLIRVAQKITPCLWFDDQAEEAAHFYTAIFKNSKITSLTSYGKATVEVSGKPKGTVMTVAFQLEGQEFIALNGGPHFTFSPAISLIVNCETQPEVDELWQRLSAGGTTERCGWLKDKYGVSWQIVPTVLAKMLQDKDTKKSERVMKALLRMEKLDIETLKRPSLDFKVVKDFRPFPTYGAPPQDATGQDRAWGRNGHYSGVRVWSDNSAINYCNTLISHRWPYICQALPAARASFTPSACRARMKSVV